MNNSVESLVPFLKEAFENNKDFKMPIKGTSMLPFLNETMLVSLTKPIELKRNDIIFYLRDNGQYVLHRIYKVKKGTYTLLGDNQTRKELNIRENQVLGKVNKVYLKNGEEKSLHAPVYLFFWNMLLIRKVCLKLRRLFKRG